jgi:hypothetical protein
MAAGRRRDVAVSVPPLRRRRGQPRCVRGIPRAADPSPRGRSGRRRPPGG